MTTTKVLCLTVLLLCSSYARAQTRRALVIGNDSYPGNSLQNARNDAKGVNDALSRVGYQTRLVLDADRRTLSNEVDAFADSIHTGDLALLYYAGHGMQVGGENFLVPTDFRISTEAAAKEQAYSLGSILEHLTSHGATTQVVILDACRDNPFLGSRSVRGGWAGMGTSAGAFLAFGTSPGSTASDDPTGGHGLFTKSLLKYLTTSDLDIEEMLRKVRQDVIHDSGGKQVPWVSSSLIGSLHVIPALDVSGPIVSAANIAVRPGEDEAPNGRTLRAVSDEVSFQPMPGEIEQRLQTAVSEARGERLDKAISIIKSVLSIDPRCALALRLLGLLFHATGRDVEAIPVLDRAIAISGDDARAASYKCAIESYIDASTAIADCAALVHAQPSADGYVTYAGALMARGYSAEAYAASSQAISSGGSDLAYALRGMIARQGGQSGIAERDFGKAMVLSTQERP